MRAGVVLSFLLMLSCGVDLVDTPGRSCDVSHPCGPERACIAGRCFAADELDGGAGGGGGSGGGSADGGTPDAGPPDAGVDAGVDAGQPTWQQRLHGFTGATRDTGCTLTIDTVRGNTLTATIASAQDNADTATADLVDPVRLPATVNGRLRGRLTLPVTPTLTARSDFLFIGTQTGTPWIRLGINAGRNLLVDSAAGTLGGAALSQNLRPDGGFARGDYIIDIEWTRGGMRRVTVDGVLLGEVPIPATGGSAIPPNELRLGIIRYDGASDAGWTATLSDWRLWDDPGIPIGGPP